MLEKCHSFPNRLHVMDMFSLHCWYLKGYMSTDHVLYLKRINPPLVLLTTDPPKWQIILSLKIVMSCLPGGLDSNTVSTRTLDVQCALITTSLLNQDDVCWQLLISEQERQCCGWKSSMLPLEKDSFCAANFCQSSEGDKSKAFLNLALT